MPTSSGRRNRCKRQAHYLTAREIGHSPLACERPADRRAEAEARAHWLDAAAASGELHDQRVLGVLRQIDPTGELEEDLRFVKTVCVPSFLSG